METSQKERPILVIGAGYVGLPYAALLARGLMRIGPVPVVLVDQQSERILSISQALGQGLDPLGEPHLGMQIRKCPDNGLIIECRSGGPAALHYQPRAIVIAVGTPPVPSGIGIERGPLLEGMLDCRGLHALFLELATVLSTTYGDGPPVPIIIRSTLPPSIVPVLEQVLAETKSRGVLFVAPEFLREGSALADLSVPSRTVIGTYHQDHVLRDFVRDLVQPKDADLLESPSSLPYGDRDSYQARGKHTHWMNPLEATLVKLTSNALLSIKVATAAAVCGYVEQNLPDGSADLVLAAVGADPRIGTSALHPGLGPAGPCLPKDWAAFCQAVGEPDPVTELGEAEAWPWPVWAIQDDMLRDEEIRHVLALGIGFKPTSKDWRNGQPLRMVRNALSWAQAVQIWDPRLSPDEAAQLRGECHPIGPDGPPIGVLEGQGWPCLRPDGTGALVQTPIPRGTVVYLFCQPPEGFLETCKRLHLLDPFALLSQERVRGLIAIGHTYAGRGRGTNWADRVSP